jgi:hypothetical protein
MTKRKSPDLAEFARAAAVESANAKVVGDFFEVIDEGDNVWSYLFSSKLNGYLDWHWSVTVFAPAKQEPTVSEVVLLPGADSMIAPNWVPWAERLADWKALQAELEAQAAAEAAEAAELETDEEDSDGELDSEIVEVVLKHDESLEDEEASALSDFEEGVDAEQDADNAGERPPRSSRRNRRRGNNKNRQGNRPKGSADNNDKA